MVDVQQEFWAHYFTRVFRESPKWLDYSNARVQAQTFALALEAAGPIAGQRCLDAGCGSGQFSRTLAALGAAHVTAVDLIAEAIESQRARHPDIRWYRGDLTDEALCRALGPMDLVFLLEVLQCLPFRPTLDAMWTLLAPGGRMVVMVPNRECPIVAKPIDRFRGRYDPPRAGQLREAVAALPGLVSWGCRGLWFQEDQRLVPYVASPWTTEPSWETPPNRFLVTVVRESTRASPGRTPSG